MKKIIISVMFLCFMDSTFAQSSPFAGGDGSVANPYQIATAVQLDSVRRYLNSSFILIANIDLNMAPYNTGYGWEPIYNYSGKFNGACHTIENLYINRSSFNEIGFFGVINGAFIDSLGIINCYVSGAVCVGGLAGINQGSISACYVSGKVSSTKNSVGGLVGTNWQSSSIKTSYAVVSVFSENGSAGGLVGYNYNGKIENCYSTSSISSNGCCAGGLVGYTTNMSNIKNCYATGNVTAPSLCGNLIGANNGIVNSCYFDYQAWGQNNGTGTALTSAQMKDSSNFTGWDFTNIWNIRTGNTYPALRGLDNAPFAFSDYIFSKSDTLNLSLLLANDYDYETLQENLIVKIDSIFRGGTSPDSTSIYIFPTNGSLDFLFYRVGEVRDTDNDTLWGNTVLATVHFLPFNGSGTVTDPFQISSLTDLYWLSRKRDLWDKSFIQTADIDASETRNWNNGEGFSPIGNVSISFSGNYNGKGHVISNLFIIRPTSDYIGLFGLTNRATIDSLGLVGANIKGSGFVGGVIGYSFLSTVSNSYNTGAISGTSAVGGIAGVNGTYSIITDSYNTGSVMGYSGIGGIAGSNSSNSKILRSYNTGSVIGSYETGGIAASNFSNSMILHSYNTGSVIGIYNTGGIVGRNIQNSMVSESYNTGSVNGTSSTGGIVAENNENSIVAGSYNAGLISGSIQTGGVVGTNARYSVLSVCYWDMEASNIAVGIGYDDNNQTATGLITSQMKDSTSFPGWNFDTIWCIRADNTYPALRGVNNAPFAFRDSIVTNSDTVNLSLLLANDYDYETLQDNLILKIDSIYNGGSSPDSNKLYIFPTNGFSDTLIYRIGEVHAIENDTLWGNTAFAILEYIPCKGTGTIDDPFQISSLKDLNWLSQQSQYWGSSFIQTADIDASDTKNWDDGKGFLPVALFTGTYNGKGHTINKLFINRPESGDIGFFGRIMDATIDSLGLIDAHITGLDRVGGIAGSAGDFSKISNSFNTGAINGNECVGGLTGHTSHRVVISGSHNTGSVTGSLSIGGIAGVMYYSNIEECDNTGIVTGSSCTGGIVGMNYLTCYISNSYNTGQVVGSMNTGGIVGFNMYSYISGSYNTGFVAGSTNTGGIAGKNEYGLNVYDSYNTGQVTGLTNTGGLVGDNFGESLLSGSYNSGRVSGLVFAGGIAGCNDPNSSIVNCYWDTEVSNTTTGIGNALNNLFTGGLSTSQMKSQASFPDWNFDLVWCIRADSTYPALQRINNAPFGFADSVVSGTRTMNLSKLLANDYDYETLQKNLVLKVDTIYSAGTTDSTSWFKFPELVEETVSDTIFYIGKLVYRVGEVRSAKNDTLWGNRASAVLVKVTNNAPFAGNDTLYSNEDITLKMPVSALLNNDSDTEKDLVLLDTILISDATYGIASVSGDTLTYVPASDWNGTETLAYIVSDGELSDTAYLIINIEPVNDAPEITSTAPITAGEGAEYTYTVVASDIEDDILTYSLSNQPAGMAVSSNVITWTPGHGILTSGAVTLTVSDGELTDSEIFTIAVTPVDAISENSIDGMSIYPNPAVDKLLIDGAKGEILKIYNLQGVQVLTKMLDNTIVTIDISGLPSGIYNLVIGNRQFKVVKE